MVQKQYAMEKFKEGFSGRNFVVEEPEFKFEAPKFKRKLNFPRHLKILGQQDILQQGNSILMISILLNTLRSLQ